MSKKNKTTVKNNLPYKKIEIIKQFAKDMGYKTETYYYNHYYNQKRCFEISLCGTWDSEGNPYSWAWYVETGKEVEPF